MFYLVFVITGQSSQITDVRIGKDVPLNVTPQVLLMCDRLCCSLLDEANPLVDDRVFDVGIFSSVSLPILS